MLGFLWFLNPLRLERSAISNIMDQYLRLFPTSKKFQYQRLCLYPKLEMLANTI